MNFSYKAKTKEGQIVEATADASDKFSLARELKSRGYVVLYIKEEKSNSFNLDDMVQNFFSKVKTLSLIHI